MFFILILWLIILKKVSVCVFVLSISTVFCFCFFVFVFFLFCLFEIFSFLTARRVLYVPRPLPKKNTQFAQIAMHRDAVKIVP